MRLGLRISAILISCCVLINQGCTPEKSASEKNSYGTQDASKDKEINNKDEEQREVVQVEENPVLVVPADPRELPPLPFGGGGGSQGAIKPARTGNPDASGHGARCGNKIQEPRGKLGNCPFDIYGTTYTDLNSGSNLVGFRLSDGGSASFTKAITYSPIGCDVRAITAIEFAPDGTLYAVGTSSCGNTVDFFRLDCQTAVATFIGNTGIESLFQEDAPHISDLDFDSHGQLYAYIRAVGSEEADQLGTINIATGAYTTIGETGLDQIGNGLASLQFPDPDELFQAGIDLNELNTNTGAAFNAQGLTFPAGENPRVRAMDRDHLHKVIYVNLQYGNVFDPTASYLAILNPDETVTYLNPSSPQAAPEDLRGITVNRTYEECDVTDFDLPIGTVCSSACELVESNCADFVNADDYPGIDNDYDGLPNCEDPDCFERPCNDHDGCTIEEACRDTPCTADNCAAERVLSCQGIAHDYCEDGNECTLDQCIDDNADQYDLYACKYNLDGSKTSYGDCTPEGNCEGDEPPMASDHHGRESDGSCSDRAVIDLCEVGRCVIPDDTGINAQGNEAVAFCESAERVDLPVEDGGCKDGNQCTADMCKEVQTLVRNERVTHGGGWSGFDIERSAVCMYSEIDNPNVHCNIDGNECSTGYCSMGDCVDLQPAPNTCFYDSDCGYGLSCQGQTLGTCQVTGEVRAQAGQDCASDLDCFSGEVCVNASPGTCSCEDGDITCTGDDACFDGACVGGPISGPECDADGSPCTVDVCFEGTCIHSVDPDLACGEETECLIPMCTENGCANMVLDGSVSCVVEGNPCLKGNLQCNDGEVFGGCVAISPPQPTVCD